MPYGDFPALAKEGEEEAKVATVEEEEERWRSCYVPYQEENREKVERGEEKRGGLEERVERVERTAESERGR